MDGRSTRWKAATVVQDICNLRGADAVPAFELSRLSEWDGRRLSCAPCAARLRDARAFRLRVTASELCFVEYCGRTDTLSDSLKLEAEDVKSDCSENSLVGNDADTIKTECFNETSSVDRKQYVRKKREKVVKRRGESSTVESDSEIPISELCVKNTQTVVGVDKIVHPSPKTVKQISERKRLQLTCHIVLRDTTACPFRHHKSWFRCFFCTQDFMDIDSLRTHTLDSHKDLETELKSMKRYPRSLQMDISVLQCKICGTSLKDVDVMKSHLLTDHNKVVYKECIADYKVNGSPYFCHLCMQEFHVFRRLTMHLNEHYANCICDVCGRSFINSKRLNVHKRTHESGNFPCTECGKILKTKTSKANHMETVHCKRRLKCQICLKPMKHYNDRMKHMSEAHNITHKFKCPICAREYNIKHYLATHIRQTHGNKNKKCTTCGMAFITNHGLKKHMLRHSGQKPYSCGVCSKTYARSYTLRDHMKVHENERFLAPE